MMAQDFADVQNNEIAYLASMNDKYIVSKKEKAANEAELPEDIDGAWREVFSSLNSYQVLNDSKVIFEDLINIIHIN